MWLIGVQRPVPESRDHLHGLYRISGESIGEETNGQAATSALEPAWRTPAATSSTTGSQSRNVRDVPALVSRDEDQNGDSGTAASMTAGPAGLVDCSSVTPPGFSECTISAVT